MWISQHGTELKGTARLEQTRGSQRWVKELLRAGENPRSRLFTELSSGTRLLCQLLFGNPHKLAPQLQNRQRLSRIHFLTYNSFPE